MFRINTANPRISDFFSGESSFFRDLVQDATNWNSDPCSDSKYSLYYEKLREIFHLERPSIHVILEANRGDAWRFLLGFVHRVCASSIPECPAKHTRIYAIDCALIRMSGSLWWQHIKGQHRSSYPTLILVNRLDHLGPPGEWASGLANAIISATFNDLEELAQTTSPFIIGTMERQTFGALCDVGGGYLRRRLRGFELPA